jgi:hypothetical protein
MTRIILILDDDYERQYLESKNYLNSKFHDAPARLKNIPGNDAWWPGMPQQDRPPRKVTPNGKRVI